MIEVLFGIISGIITSLGMGGGSILILLLSIFTDYSQKISQGINLIFFIPCAIISILINLKNKNIDLKNCLVIAFFGIIGALIGSQISMKISDFALRRSFIFFLIMIVIYEIYVYLKKYILSEKKK